MTHVHYTSVEEGNGQQLIWQQGVSLINLGRL